MLIHSATISCTGAPRAILNLPVPYAQARLREKQGPLSGVVLPIIHAGARSLLCPRPLLWLLWTLALAAGWLHRTSRGRRGDRVLDLLKAKLLYLPSCVALVLNALCFTLLDVMTSLSVHDEHLPLVESGCSDAKPWRQSMRAWGAASAAAAQQLAGALARLSGLRRSRAPARLAELKPLVDPSMAAAAGDA